MSILKRIRRCWQAQTGHISHTFEKRKWRLRRHELDRLEDEMERLFDALPSGHPERRRLINDLFRLRSLRTFTGT